MIDLNVNLYLTTLGGGGREVKGQKSIEDSKTSLQTLITCEWQQQVGPSNLFGICMSMRAKNIHSEYLHLM